MERYYLDDLMALEDPIEGLKAFLEKRPPVWQDPWFRPVVLFALVARAVSNTLEPAMFLPGRAIFSLLAEQPN